MKDYYQTLGIPEDASDEDIRKAFRKLAFQYHPDKNIGNEKAAEKKFKEINEAFGVLSDKVKRQQYDMARKGVFAGGREYEYQTQGFRYSQDDIFRDTFTNQAMMEEMERLFSQMGLRFDPEFLNRVFFNANNVVFRVYRFGGSPRGYSYTRGYSSDNVRSSPADQDQVAPAEPQMGFLERTLSNAGKKIGKFVLKKVFGIQLDAPPIVLDRFQDLDISSDESRKGGEKAVSIKDGNRTKKLMVKIPAGIQSGTQIRLRGMGYREGNRAGDLYLKVRVAD